MSDPLRRELGAAGGHSKYAGIADRTAATDKMRAAFKAKFEAKARELLGPDATIDQVAASADSLIRAHYALMRANSIKSRRAAAAARKQAEMDAMVDALLADEKA